MQNITPDINIHGRQTFANVMAIGKLIAELKINI